MCPIVRIVGPIGNCLNSETAAQWNIQGAPGTAGTNETNGTKGTNEWALQ
jgi:hypothetical protein